MGHSKVDSKDASNVHLRSKVGMEMRAPVGNHSIAIGYRAMGYNAYQEWRPSGSDGKGYYMGKLITEEEYYKIREKEAKVRAKEEKERAYEEKLLKKYAYITEEMSMDELKELHEHMIKTFGDEYDE